MQRRDGVQHPRWARPAMSLALALAIVLLLSAETRAAQTYNSGSTGADGPFNPPTNVPPGTTVNGNTYTVPLPPSGTLNFTTITIPSGVAVTFQPNATNTPVFLLASGDVLVNGTINVSGQPGGAGTGGEPALMGLGGTGGPGGFAGGNGGRGSRVGGYDRQAGGSGLGPGGGITLPDTSTSKVMGGRFGDDCPCDIPPGTPTPHAYGTPSLVPLIGGSGGAGGYSADTLAYTGHGGGGGGGAILMASSGTITLNGNIVADGRVGFTSYDITEGGGGSGGAIRLVATTMTGGGGLFTRGAEETGALWNGGAGRIRIEAFVFSYIGTTVGVTSYALPGPTFATTNPTLAITTVAGIAAPASPGGSFSNPDIVLPSATTNPVTVSLAASNVPLGTTVKVVVTAFSGGLVATTTSTGLAGTVSSSTATASVSVPLDQPSVLLAEATFPLTASAGTGPVYAEGEEVKWVRVASTLGGGSTVTYITASGKEIPADPIARLPQ